MKTFLIFDLETDGLPKARNRSYTDINNFPEILQVSWCFCMADEENRVLINEEYYDKYLKYMGTKDVFYSPHITTKLLEEEGHDHKEVIEDIIEILSRTDYIISHNIEFDLTILFSFLHKNKAMSKEFLGIKTFCTMQRGTDICAIPNKWNRDRYKYPTLKELYQYYTNKEMDEARAHNSQYDTECLTDICRIMIFSLILA
jgi:DNA polymerase-3 subunit alpha